MLAIVQVDFMQTSATSARGLSTFLLEMALDEARIRERLSERLLAERETRGGGNTRRFPQPMMADLLDVTLRTYQEWEGAVRVPSWRNLEKIAERLGIEITELFEDDEEEVEPAVTFESELHALREELAGVRAVVERVEKLLRASG